MQIKDRIYGNCTIKDELAEDIIKSQPMQRLSSVNQHGAAAFVFSRLNITRLEHSIGVYLLLKKIGAQREEQIAGLLHDISHTAFSHVIDFVFHNSNQDYHEQKQEETIRDSELPKIFAKHGFSTSDFLLNEEFALLDREVPDLCCDRLDYFLRDYASFYGKDRSSYLSWIKTENNEIYFTNKIEARKCAEDFMDIDKSLWGSSPTSIAAFKILADCLKLAIENDIITVYDLEKDNDRVIMEKLRNSRNLKIAVMINKLRPGFSAKASEKEFDFIFPCKARWLDPKIRVGKSLKRLSETDKTMKKKLDDYISSAAEGIKIKIMS